MREKRPFPSSGATEKLTRDTAEPDADRFLQRVAGEAEYVRTETEADGVQVPGAKFRMVRLQTDQKGGGTLARLLGVEGGRRVARQPGQLTPVDDEDVRVWFAQVRCRSEVSNRKEHQ